jgi:hypothetical protein
MPKPIAAYFSHHKCASDWTLRVLKQLADAIGMKVHHSHWPVRLPLGYHNEPKWAGRIAESWEYAANGDYDLLIATNAEMEHVRTLTARGFHGFHVIRDPRDIIVSGYFSHLASHPVDPDQNPWLMVHRELLNRCGKEEGLLAELDYSSTHPANALGRISVADIYQITAGNNGTGSTLSSYTNIFYGQTPQTGVPEPMSFVLMGAGLVGIAALRRRNG